MRAVNLLPDRDRARVAKPAPAGASQTLLAVLGLAVVAMLLVVFSQNQVSDRKQELVDLRAEQQAAQQKSASLGSFGQFAEIKETRVDSISQLAKERFDWERFMRELALVLPKGTWLADVKASGTGQVDPAGGAAPTSAPTTSGSPSAEIMGCAKNQSRVAELMVRLRNLDRAEDVTLAESSGPAPGETATSGSTNATSGGGEGDCGANYRFTAKVAFSTKPSGEAQGPKSVPSRLGGGS